MPLPETYQQNYTTTTGGLRVGDLAGVDVYNDPDLRATIPVRAVQPQITRATAVANDTDTVGLSVDGGDFTVVSPATNPLLAQAQVDRLEGAPLLDSVLAAVVDTDDVVITFQDNDPHEVLALSPATADFTPIINDQEAVANERLLPGMGVVRAVEGPGFIARPTSAAQQLYGVLYRCEAQIKPDDQSRIAGFDPNFLQPGDSYGCKAKGLILVRYFGPDPVTTNGRAPAFLIHSGENAGWWRADSGEVLQVTTYSVTTSAADDISFRIDNLGALTTAATNNAANDAASLVAAWEADSAYRALGTIVDNADGTFTVSYTASGPHTLTDLSTGANAVTASASSYTAPVAELAPAYFDFVYGAGSGVARLLADAPA